METKIDEICIKDDCELFSQLKEKSDAVGVDIETYAKRILWNKIALDDLLDDLFNEFKKEKIDLADKSKKFNYMKKVSDTISELTGAKEFYEKLKKYIENKK